MASSVVLEIVNERVFSGQGTVYPCTLLPLWPMEFPVAIVLATGLYALLVAVGASQAVRFVPPRHGAVRLIVLTVATLLLNILSLAMEHAGVAVGYWSHLRAADLSRIYPQIYLFYLTAALPASLLFFILKPRGDAA
jgi:hypothetical protein